MKHLSSKHPSVTHLRNRFVDFKMVISWRSVMALLCQESPKGENEFAIRALHLIMAEFGEKLHLQPADDRALLKAFWKRLKRILPKHRYLQEVLSTAHRNVEVADALSSISCIVSHFVLREVLAQGNLEDFGSGERLDVVINEALKALQF